jgi:ABC-type multidrug transport system ATPase subunit
MSAATRITWGIPPGFYTHRQIMSTVSDLQAEITENTKAQATPAVQLDRVSRLYGSFVALREVTVSLPAGSSVVMLGENGAGKSTLLKVIAGLQSPSYGTVSIFGESPRDQRGMVAYMSHSTMLYDELTGIENLTYFGSLHTEGVGRATLQEKAAEALIQVGLDPANTRRVGEYSQGMRQRASLARVLLSEPDLLLLDEPFSNLDVGSAQSMITRLLAYVAKPSRSGLARTLLLTTHQAELARPLAQSTLTLNAGRLVSLVETR